MRTRALVDTEWSESGASEITEKVFHAVIVYDDIPAGKRGMKLVGELGAHLETNVELRVQPWRLDFLSDPEWGGMALSDAVLADLIIICTTHPFGGSSALENWLTACCARRKGTNGAIVAMFGTTEELPDFHCRQLEAIQRTAIDAGLDFFAPQTRFFDIEGGRMAGSRTGNFSEQFFQVGGFDRHN